VDAGNGQIEEATNSVASSGEMLGKLREFVEKANQTDAEIRASRAKERAAAADANIELASLDTLGPLGKFNSLAQFNPIGQSGSVVSLPPTIVSAGLPPGPASASLGPSPGLESKDRASAMLDKITNEFMDSEIHHMWTQVVGHASKSVTDGVMTLLKGQ